MQRLHDRIAALEGARPQPVADVLGLTDAGLADILRNALAEIESSDCPNDGQVLADFRGKLQELEATHAQAH